ncbi:MAG: hypothetical protein IT462_09375 [Planctomycetes bacterium]|nr:hypothetical protein [Planctomycetota bacterium]
MTTAPKAFSLNPQSILVGAFALIVGCGIGALAIANRGTPAIAPKVEAEVAPRGLGPGIRGEEQVSLRAALKLLPATENNVAQTLTAYAASVETRDTARVFGYEMTGELAGETVMVSAETAAAAPVAEVAETKVETIEAPKVEAIEAAQPAKGKAKDEDVLAAVATGSARERYEAWDAVAADLDGSDVDTLRRVAALIGATGSLPLEWKIAHRLSQLTGEDFGLDTAAWTAYFAG